MTTVFIAMKSMFIHSEHGSSRQRRRSSWRWRRSSWKSATGIPEKSLVLLAIFPCPCLVFSNIRFSGSLAFPECKESGRINRQMQRRLGEPGNGLVRVLVKMPDR